MARPEIDLTPERLAQIRSAAKSLRKGSAGIAGNDGGRVHIEYHPRDVFDEDEFMALAYTAEDLPEILEALLDGIEAVTSDDMIEKFAAVPSTWTRIMSDGYLSTGWRSDEDVARDTLDVVRSTIRPAKDS